MLRKWLTILSKSLKKSKIGEFKMPPTNNLYMSAKNDFENGAESRSFIEG